LSCRRWMGNRSRQRLSTMILLTEGRDTSSRLARSAATDDAIKSDTIVYAIGIRDSRYDGTDKDALNDIAERTGGRAAFAKKAKDLKDAFAVIETELRSRYSVTYQSTNKKHDGSARKIKIEITKPDLEKEHLKLRYVPRYFAK